MAEKKPRTDLDAKLTDKQRAALARLRSYGIFFNDHLSELEDGEDEKWLRAINLNDTFWWGSAYTEFISDDEIEEVDSLFYNYGWCGILYWSAKKGNITPEFNHVKRMIAFVENEERIKKDKTSSQYAYSKDTYTIG